MKLIDEDLDPVRATARRALLHADALGQIPTPLDQIAAAANLAPAQPLFDEVELPSGLLMAVRRLKGKVQGAFAFRERIVYLDRKQCPERQRFTHGHELGHGLLPWQRGAYQGDDYSTLLPETKSQLEAEASAFSAELLFQLDSFSDAASDWPLGLAIPLDLAGTWGTSRHAAIRRYVETNPRACAVLGLGRYPVRIGSELALKILWTIESAAFRSRYGPTANCLPTFLPISSWDLARVGYDMIHQVFSEPIGAGQLKLIDSRRGPVPLEYELFFNHYQLFAFVFRRPRLPVKRRVRTAWR
jgi:hypothetical protein